MANSFEVAAEHHRLEIGNCEAKGLLDFLEQMLTGAMHSPEELSKMVAKPAIAKYDHFLSPVLLGQVAMAERLDLAALPGVLARILRPVGCIPSAPDLGNSSSKRYADEAVVSEGGREPATGPNTVAGALEGPLTTVTVLCE